MNIANIYVSIFVNSHEFLFLPYRWKIYPTLYMSFPTIIFNKITMKMVDIHVSIAGYIVKDINNNRQRINSQHFMLVHPNFRDISIDTNK